MIKNVNQIIKQNFKKGLSTYKNFFNLEEGQSPGCLNVEFNNDGSISKRLGTSTMNSVILESTGGYGMYDFGVLGIGGDDNNTKLLLHFNGTPIVDSSPRNYAITTYGGIAVSSLQSKFGGASGLFAESPEIDYMEEYSSDAKAQAAYVSSDTAPSEVVSQQQTTGENGILLGDYLNDELRVAQSFQLSVDSTISAIEIKRYALTLGVPSGNWTIRIETDNSDSPSGTLANANASVVVVPPAEGAIVKGTFASSFTLNANTKYWIKIDCDNQATTQAWYIAWNPAGSYTNGTAAKYETGAWTVYPDGDLYFKVYVNVLSLQSYSESTIKQQGSYSLKGSAAIAVTLTHNLARTLTSSALKNLTGQDSISFDIYSSRTGSNISFGLQNSAAALMNFETAPFINSANAWQTVNWNISSYVATSKNNINKIIISITDATAANTFYIDNVYSGSYLAINKSKFLTVPDDADWTLGGKNFTIDNQIMFNYLQSPATSQALIGQGSDSSNYWLYSWDSGNYLNFEAKSANTLIVKVTGLWAPTTGTFQHLALVRNTTNSWYMFVNGASIAVAGTTAGIIPDFGSLLKIGVNVVTTDNAYLCAFADEWRFSDNARWVNNFTPPNVEFNSDILQERRLLCASGTGIYYSTNIGKTWALAQTSRAAAINYFSFVKDYVINTNENYQPPQYWAGTMDGYFANISTATPACKHSLSHQGFCIFLNESANKTSMYYVDQNSMFNSVFSNFKLPTDRNDELTGGFSLGRNLYISSKYKIFRLSYIGGNPDWEYTEVRGFGFVPKTVKKINLPNAGEGIIGLDWSKKLRIFLGGEDEIISDQIQDDNGITSFYLDNINSVDLNKCWAENDKKAQVYRLFLVCGNSSTVSYCLNFNYRTGALYPEDNRSFQSGVLAEDTASNLSMLACNYNGRIHVLDSGNTEAAVPVNDHFISPLLYLQTPTRVHKAQQINLFFSPSDTNCIYFEDRSQFSSVWNLRKAITLSSAVSSIQIRHTIDVPETMNTYQFRLSSSSCTSEPWRLNLIDYSQSNLGLGGP